MKTNSIKHKITRRFVFIIGAVFLGSIFGFPGKAANILLPAGSRVNDVAVNSLNGTIYYTTTDGKLKDRSTGSEISLPPSKKGPIQPCTFAGRNGFRDITTTYDSFTRITVDVKGTLWAIVTGTTFVDCLGNMQALPGIPYLFFRDGCNWTEVPGASIPADVGSSGVTSSFQKAARIYIVSASSPFEAFFGSKESPNNFGTLGKNDFRAIDGGKDNYTAWAVARNGTLWNYFANVIDPTKRWTAKNQTGVVDISVNKTSGRIYITKSSGGMVGEIWYSDDNGRTFVTTRERNFKNIAVRSNGTVYAAGIDGSLQSF